LGVNLKGSVSWPLFLVQAFDALILEFSTLLDQTSSLLCHRISDVTRLLIPKRVKEGWEDQQLLRDCCFSDFLF